jgi:hypothetical protein
VDHHGHISGPPSVDHHSHISGPPSVDHHNIMHSVPNSPYHQQVHSVPPSSVHSSNLDHHGHISGPPSVDHHNIMHSVPNSPYHQQVHSVTPSSGPSSVDPRLVHMSNPASNDHQSIPNSPMMSDSSVTKRRGSFGPESSGVLCAVSEPSTTATAGVTSDSTNNFLNELDSVFNETSDFPFASALNTDPMPTLKTPEKLMHSIPPMMMNNETKTNRTNFLGAITNATSSTETSTLRQEDFQLHDDNDKTNDSLSNLFDEMNQSAGQSPKAPDDPSGLESHQ